MAQKTTKQYNSSIITSEIKCIICEKKLELKEPFNKIEWLKLQENFIQNHKLCLNKNVSSFGINLLKESEIWMSLTINNRIKLNKIMTKTIVNCINQTKNKLIEFMEEEMFINDSNRDQFTNRLNEVL